MQRRAVVGLISLVVLVAGACVVPPTTPAGRWVLLFTRTEGFHHDSIAPAGQALTVELHERGYGVVVTDQPGIFTPESLARYHAVVFLQTTGDVLDPPEEAALQAWVQGGGGWTGVHSALDTEYGWPFYGTLAGARFANHPAIQPATVHVEDGTHPSTTGLPTNWMRTDEWYNTQANPRPDVHVLATVDEGTYTGGTMGADHPVAWCRTVGAGQSFTTAMGHTGESWADPAFLGHVVGGIEATMTPGSCA